MNDVPVTLPGHCTDVIVQKKNSDRVSLFIDGTFVEGFYRDVIEEAGVRPGVLVTPELYEHLLEREQYYRLREQIYRWLAVRNHSSGEIRKKSRAKGYASKEIEKVIGESIEKGILNDALFARQFAEEKAGRRAWGPMKIQAALSQKGLKKQYIDAALDGLFTEHSVESDLFTAALSAKRRVMRTDDRMRRKKKLVDFLIRRGFPPPIVFEKSDDILKRLENEET